MAWLIVLPHTSSIFRSWSNKQKHNESVFNMSRNGEKIWVFMGNFNLILQKHRNTTFKWSPCRSIVQHLSA